MAESSSAADFNMILPCRFEPDSLWRSSEESAEMIPIAKQVLLKDWATLSGALARNVYLCHMLLSAFVAASY